MNEKFLSGKTALVTGSAQGIGLAIATRLAQAGAAIVLHGLATPAQVAEAETSLRQSGAADVMFSDVDVRDIPALDMLMRKAIAWRNGIDVLVNNAGIQHTASVIDMPTERWDAIIAINLSAAFHTMQRALPA